MRKVEQKIGRTRGFTLVELMVTMVIMTIPILAAGILMYNGQKTWNRLYDDVNHPVQQDAHIITETLQKWGRRANRLDYVIYNVQSSTFTEALPSSGGPDEQTVVGDAVELRYWNETLQSGDSTGLLDTQRTATAYALLYLEGTTLKMDTGDYPPGGVDGSGSRNTSGGTMTIAENVTSIQFSHTVISDVGQGAIRVEAVLTNPDSGDTLTVLTSVLLRNMWPR